LRVSSPVRKVEPVTATTSTARATPRAEHVGSLLRPPELLAAVEEFYDPRHTAMLAEERKRDLTALRALEDELIRDVVARQIAVGLDTVTDGEYRRVLFTNSFYDAVEGTGPPAEPVVFRNAEGDVEEFAGLPTIRERLRKIDSPAAREAAFVRSLSDRPVKITFPTGSWWYAPHVSGPRRRLGGYGTREEFAEHALSIQRELVGEAIDAGAAYVQFDSPPYVWLCDERLRNDVLPSMGFDPNVLLDEFIAADREVVEGIPEGVRVGMHICRGNFRSRWMMSGSLEPVAERMFNELPYDTFLVEWEDTARHGDFSPLRFVPEGPVVALGIVSSKIARVESDEEILARVDEAAQFLDLDQLALCPQCGFASTAEGNELDENAQWRKLELIARVADRLW
jgi:5-methyltetrahydropteroyltriglutamate--homocysteine methyltransferase